MGGAVEGDAMQIRNAQLGTVTIDEETILTFEEGLYAFEDLTRYALIEAPELVPFQWLLSIDEPEVAFAAVNPLFVRPDFEFELSRRFP